MSFGRLVHQIRADPFWLPARKEGDDEPAQEHFREAVSRYREHGENWRARVAVDRALVSRNRRPALAWIADELKRDGLDAEVAMAAAVVLGMCGSGEDDRKGALLLAELAENRRERVRYRVARSIERLAQRSIVSVEARHILKDAAVVTSGLIASRKPGSVAFSASWWPTSRTSPPQHAEPVGRWGRELRVSPGPVVSTATAPGVHEAGCCGGGRLGVCPMARARLLRTTPSSPSRGRAPYIGHAMRAFLTTRRGDAEATGVAVQSQRSVHANWTPSTRRATWRTCF